jgi:hypothetical protein
MDMSGIQYFLRFDLHQWQIILDWTNENSNQIFQVIFGIIREKSDQLLKS